MGAHIMVPKHEECALYIHLIVRNYFVDRKFLHDTDVGPVEYLVTGGVHPQLWKAMYNHVLRIKLPRQATLTNYSDNIAIVTAGKHLEDVV